MTNDDHGHITQAELVSLYTVIQRYCACRLSDPAVLEELCEAHALLRDDLRIRRLVSVKRDAQRYIDAEFKPKSAS